MNGHGRSGLQRRPSSIAELADKALDNAYDEGKDLKYYLRIAERYRKEGKEVAKQGDLETAFVLLAKAATLVLEKLPNHRDYQTLLNPSQRNNLTLNGQDILDHLSEIKPTLVDRFDKWLKANPDGVEHEASPVVVNASQAQANAARFQEEERLRNKSREQQQRAAEEAALWREQREDINRRVDAETRQRKKDAAVAAAHRASTPGNYGSQHTVVVMPSRHQQQQDEFRRREEEINRKRTEERRKLELDYISQRQLAADDAAKSIRQNIPVTVTTAGIPIGPLYPQSTTTPTRYAGSPTVHHPPIFSPMPYAPSYPRTPTYAEGPSVMPLESPNGYEGDSTDSESINYDSQRRIAARQRHPVVSHRAPIASASVAPPITTTSPPPGPQHKIDYPRLMSPHQQKQGYYPSLHSMFGPETLNTQSSLLFDSNSHQPFPGIRTNVPILPPPPPPPISYPNYQGPSRPAPPIPGPPPPPPPPVIERVSRDGASTVGNTPVLKQVNFPRECLPRFLAIARVNTANNRETCGLLLGKDKGHKFVVTTLLIPKQHATSDTCTMDEEQLVLEFTEERSLITLGWIHTHPSQSCFMSSVDLHTHSGFQRMLPESFAVVCAPSSKPNFGIFRLTDPPGLQTVLHCTVKEAFHPHPDIPIYTDADKGHVQMKDGALEIVDLR